MVRSCIMRTSDVMMLESAWYLGGNLGSVLIVV